MLTGKKYNARIIPRYIHCGGGYQQANQLKIKENKFKAVLIGEGLLLLELRIFYTMKVRLWDYK